MSSAPIGILSMQRCFKVVQGAGPFSGLCWLLLDMALGLAHKAELKDLLVSLMLELVLVLDLVCDVLANQGLVEVDALLDDGVLRWKKF